MPLDNQPTLNGLNVRVESLEKIINIYVKEIKEDIRQLRENEIPHLQEDIEALKKSQWRIMGGLAVLIFLIEAGIRVLPLLLK